MITLSSSISDKKLTAYSEIENGYELTLPIQLNRGPTGATGRTFDTGRALIQKHAGCTEELPHPMWHSRNGANTIHGPSGAASRAVQTKLPNLGNPFCLSLVTF